MTISPLALELMEYSDKTENCHPLQIYSRHYKKGFYCYAYEDLKKSELIGLSFGWGRVCMLYRQHPSKGNVRIQYNDLVVHFQENPEEYDRDCLSWSQETQKLVLEFLKSLSINKSHE